MKKMLFVVALLLDLGQSTLSAHVDFELYDVDNASSLDNKVRTPIEAMLFRFRFKAA